MTNASSSSDAAATEHAHRPPYVSRDELLSQLSPEDAAVVSAAEEAAAVGSGEQYVDLHHLDRGVRTVRHAGQLRNVLPRRAVDDQLWLQIVTQKP